MNDLIDITSTSTLPIESNGNENSEEPVTKKRKSKNDHGNIETYFDRVKEGKKVNFVCKLKKTDGSDCKMTYVGPTTTNAL